MNTSGVLLAAKDRATASAAHAQFRAKAVSKAYLALALGTPRSSSFSVDGAIGQHPAVKVARQVAQGGQHALTHMEVRGWGGGNAVWQEDQYNADWLLHLVRLLVKNDGVVGLLLVQSGGLTNGVSLL